MRESYDRQTYVVLRALRCSWRVKRGDDIHNGYTNSLVEIAAVKVEDRKIVGNFTSFVDVGASGGEIEFSEYDINFTSVTPLHLIGAPPLEEVVREFIRFANGGKIVLSGFNSARDVDELLQEAKRQGAKFDEIIDISSVYIIQTLRERLLEEELTLASPNIIGISKCIAMELHYDEIFVNYDIFTALDDRSNICQDVLSQALAFAQLFLKLLDDNDEYIKEVSLPFD